MGQINKFEDLDIWQKARDLCYEIYHQSEKGSLSRDFALWNQMNKSSGSIMDNIAEGFEREGRREFINFLSIAKSSAAELRSQLYRARDRKHIIDEDFTVLFNKVEGIGRMLGGFMNYLKNCEIKGLKYKVSENEVEYESAKASNPKSEIRNLKLNIC